MLLDSSFQLISSFSLLHVTNFFHDVIGGSEVLGMITNQLGVEH